MRTATFGTLSTRDLAAIKERREFERQEDERQRLDEDRVQYEQQYVRTVEEDQQRVAPAYRINPIPFDAWRAYADPTISDPVLRGQIATNRALLSLAEAEEQKKRDAAADDVKAGKPDPAWEIPPSAAGLSMSVDAAKSFVRSEADAFVEHTPSYYPCKHNWNRIQNYIETQGIAIPNRDVFNQAFERLSDLGLLEQRPTPEPTPEPEPQSPEPINDPKLVDGFDPETGEPRKFTQVEIWKMDSTTYRKAFRMWGDSRPRFTKGYFD